MNAAACLTLAGIYLLVWWKQRENWEHLVFSFTAVAGAALAAFELEMLLRDRRRAIRGAPALGAGSRVGAGRFTGGFRAALPPCRATMARVECLWCADTGGDPEFYFHTQS